MKILPITNSPNTSYKGRVSKNVAELTKSMSDRWTKAATSGRYTTLPIINTCIFAAERINNVFLNLSTIMERFGHGCELDFKKAVNSNKYRFFIENKYSSYKTMCDDVEFSPEINKLTDIDVLEKVENYLAKLNPYRENSHFIIQRKKEATEALLNKEFIPDEDYIFLEDKLVGKEPLKQATIEDIDAFIAAAKKEGVL